MASKKNKKSKGTTLSLQEFNSRLDDGKAPSAGQNVIYAPKKAAMPSWADEVEDDDFVYEKEKIFLPSAPRASRGPAYDDSEIPREAPFVAHLGNLSYDIGEDDVYKFFRDLDIVELRLPRDGNSNRLRGFGYVEFATRQDLVDALIQNEQMLKGRPARVNLGTNQNRDGSERRGGDRGGDRGGYHQDETPDDWRSTMKDKSSFDPLPQGPPSNFGRRDRDGGSGPRDFGRDRDRDNYGMSRPPRPEGGGGRDRDRDRDSGGRGRDFDRGYRGGSQEEEGPDDWRSLMKPKEEFSRPQYESRPSPQSFERRQHSEERRGPPPPPRDEPDHQADRQDETPRERKKLVLAPRTVPVPVGETAPETASSIFGGAKPVDTSVREREIEEKLAQAQIKTKPESPSPREQRESENDQDPDQERERERSHDDDTPPQRYRILQRPSAERTVTSENVSNQSEFDSQSQTKSPPSSVGPPLSQPQQQPPPLSSSGRRPQPPKVQIQTRAREDRERQMSTSSSRGSLSEHPPYNNHSHHHQSFNGSGQHHQQLRSVPSHSHGSRGGSGSSSIHYPVPPAPGAAAASSFNRRKSDSDEGDHHDDRNSRHERQRDVPAPPPVNVWNRNRSERDRDNFRSRQDSHGGGGGTDRKTPDSDRNAEKEKDSHSEPEDDRDTHRFIGEKPYGKDGGDEDGEFRRIERRERGDYGNRDRNDSGYGRRGGDRGGNWNNTSGPRRGDERGGGVGGPRRGSGGVFQDDRDRRGGGGGRDDRDRRDRDRRDDRDRLDRDVRGGERRGDRGGGMMDRDNRDRVDRDRDFRRDGPSRMDRGYNDRGGRDQGQGPPVRRNGGPPMDNKGPRGPPRISSRDNDYYRDSDGFEVFRGGRERPMPKFTEDKPALVAGKNNFSALNDDVGSD